MSTSALDPSLLPNLRCDCPDSPTAGMAGWFFTHMLDAEAEAKLRGLCNKDLLRMMVNFVCIYAENCDAGDRARVAGEMFHAVSRIIAEHGREMLPFLIATQTAEPPGCGVPDPKSPWAI